MLWFTLVEETLEIIYFRLSADCDIFTEFVLDFSLSTQDPENRYEYLLNYWPIIIYC